MASRFKQEWRRENKGKKINQAASVDRYSGFIYYI